MHPKFDGSFTNFGQFGNDMTYQWIVSMLVSFFSSVIITQPVKVSCYGLRPVYTNNEFLSRNVARHT
jgi:hypothetical protein